MIQFYSIMFQWAPSPVGKCIST